MANQQVGAMDYNTLHEEGAKRFKLRWLAINQVLAETAKTNGIDPTKNRLALARMAWKTLILVENWQGPVKKQIIGYRYTNNGAYGLPEVVMLCCDCNTGYRADYPNYILNSELFFNDSWAESRICDHCGLRLGDAREQQESQER